MWEREVGVLGAVELGRDRERTSASAEASVCGVLGGGRSRRDVLRTGPRLGGPERFPRSSIHDDLLRCSGTFLLPRHFR